VPRTALPCPLPVALIALAVLAGCGDWPTPMIPNQTASASEDWPSLVPVAPLLARAEAPQTGTAPPADRIAALNARAAALRADAVITPAARARIDAGIDPDALAALN
jgi:hypothetical protein